LVGIFRPPVAIEGFVFVGGNVGDQVIIGIFENGKLQLKTISASLVSQPAKFIRVRHRRWCDGCEARPSSFVLDIDSGVTAVKPSQVHLCSTLTAV